MVRQQTGQTCLNYRANGLRSIVNEAAAASPVQPIINLGQGFFGYNPPEFVLNAAKNALDRVECNQYSPTKVRTSHCLLVLDAHAHRGAHDC